MFVTSIVSHIKGMYEITKRTVTKKNILRVFLCAGVLPLLLFDLVCSLHLLTVLQGVVELVATVKTLIGPAFLDGVDASTLCWFDSDFVGDPSS